MFQVARTYDAGTEEERPNGLPLSCRERWECLPKCHRSRARSGRLQRRVRHLARTFEPPTAWADHTGTVPHPAPRAFGRQHAPHRTTPSTTSRSVGTTPSTESHTARRVVRRNHIQHTIGLPITSTQHHGRAYHTPHNEQSAQRAVVPRLHNERRHAGVGTTSIPESWSPSATAKTGVDHAATGAERSAVQLPQAHGSTAQKSTDLVRAAVGWNGGFGDLVRRSGVAVASANHTSTVSRQHDEPFGWNHAQLRSHPHNALRSGATASTRSRKA